MKALEIVVDTNSFRVSRAGALTGRLHVKIDGRPFPDDSWNDFVIVVLGWWCETMASFSGSHAGSARMRFMDGPFAIELQRTEVLDSVAIALVCDNAAVPTGVTGSVSEIVSALRQASVLALERGLALSCSSTDISTLRVAASALSKS